MCDTLVAAGNTTRRGRVIFGKNSDRPPNEAQPLLHRPRLAQQDTMVQCQNIAIPQVQLTYEHLGSRPYWLWGYEHGLNEFGVAIGNLGVASKEPFETPADKAGLIGMDLVRLGLERSRNAPEAVKVITNLLEEYGPGYCESPNVAKYHNNYLIADPEEAWALETAGRYWAAKRILDGVYHVGNLYSIQTEWDKAHPRLIDHAIERGWCTSTADFNFAKTYGDYLHQPITGSMIRYRRGLHLLEQHKGRITPAIMMEILRDHLEGTFLESFWAPGENFYASICCHERGGGEWSGGQTAASMVVELKKDEPNLLKAQCWAAMTAPCTSIFLPFYPRRVKTPDNLSVADTTYSAASPWWGFKRLQRHTERNYPALGPVVRKAWKKMERRMIRQRTTIEDEARELIRKGAEDDAVQLLQNFVDTCTTNALRQLRMLDSQLYDIEKNTPNYCDLRREHLNTLNKEAKIEI